MNEYDNGFSCRKKIKKTQLKVINSVPFSLIAKHEPFSKQFYGIEPIKNVDFNISAEKLKNTNYIGFDYEKHCKQDPITSITSKISTISINKISRKCKF